MRVDGAAGGEEKKDWVPGRRKGSSLRTTVSVGHFHVSGIPETWNSPRLFVSNQRLERSDAVERLE